MTDKNKPQDDSKILGDINPVQPRRSDTQPRRPGSTGDSDGDAVNEEDDKERQDHPGTRDLGQSTEGTGGGSRNYRPAGTTGSDIGNRPE